MSGLGGGECLFVDIVTQSNNNYYHVSAVQTIMRTQLDNMKHGRSYKANKKDKGVSIATYGLMYMPREQTRWVYIVHIVAPYRIPELEARRSTIDHLQDPVNNFDRENASTHLPSHLSPNKHPMSRPGNSPSAPESPRHLRVGWTQAPSAGPQMMREFALSSKTAQSLRLRLRPDVKPYGIFTEKAG